MGKIIFFDVDGTLYRSDCLVPRSTIDAIYKLNRNGHIPMVCTGRGACTLPIQVEVLPLHGGVCGCGTYVSIDRRVLTDAGVTGSDVREILAIMQKHQCPFFIDNSDHFYCDPLFMSERLKHIVANMQKRYIGRYRPISELPDKISKMTAYPTDGTDLPALIRALSPWFDVITHAEYEYIEIVPLGYSKGTGVKQIIEALGAHTSDTYGFGDSGNDTPMLEAVGTGIVMGDAPDELKSRFLTTDSLYSDGISKALRRLGLI